MLLSVCWWGIVVPLISAESDWILHGHGGQPISSRCPCLPAERCPRVFGVSPESDYRAFGHLPICKDDRLVRCCGASFQVKYETLEVMDNKHLTEDTTVETTTLTDEEITKESNNLYIIFARNSNKGRSTEEDQSPVVVILPETTPSETEETEASTEEMQTTTTTEISSVETTTQSRQKESIKSILARRRPPLFRPKPARLQRLSNPQKVKNQTSPIAESQSRVTEVVTIRRPPRVLPKLKLSTEKNIDSSRELLKRTFGQRINPRIRSKIEDTMSFGNRFLQQISSLHATIMDKLGFNFKEEKNSADDVPREESSLPLSWLRTSIPDDGPKSEIIFEPSHQMGHPVNINEIPSEFEDLSQIDDDSALLQLQKENLPYGPYDTTNILPGSPPKPPIPPAIPEEVDIDLKNADGPLKDFINKMHMYHEQQQNYYSKQVEYYEKQQKYYEDLENHVERIRTIGA